MDKKTIKEVKNREDIINLLESIIIPSFENRKMYIKDLGHYSEEAADFEQFSRLVLGLTPYLKCRFNDEILQMVLRELESYICPDSDKYINILEKPDNSQIYCEMFAPLFFIYIFRDECDNFISKNKENISNWFSIILDLNFGNNWIWFQIMVNTLLYKIGVKEFDYKLNDKHQKRLNSLYVDDGYYIDGNNGYFDYYNTFSFFFYSLIYVKLMSEEDSKHCTIFMEQARKFSDIYISFFNDEGINIPYGRSLIYRFAVLGYASAQVYSNIQIIEWGYLKDLLFKSINNWIKKDIFLNNMYLSNGFYYENQNILEDYNAYGSPFWAFKAFIFLADENDKFWESDRQDFKLLKKEILIKNVIIKEYEGEQYLFPIINDNKGYKCTLYHDKYEKTVYSTLFGFNITKGDSMTTVGIDNNQYISLDGVSCIKLNLLYTLLISKDILLTKYDFFNSTIEEYKFIQMPFILHVYLIKSDSRVLFIEGSSPVEDSELKILNCNGWCIAKNNYQMSGIKSVGSLGFEKVIKQTPNSNVMYKKNQVPICIYEINKGVSIHSTITVCCRDIPQVMLEPKITNNHDTISITFGDLDYKFNIENQSVKTLGKKVKYIKNFIRLIKILLGKV